MIIIEGADCMQLRSERRRSRARGADQRTMLARACSRLSVWDREPARATHRQREHVVLLYERMAVEPLQKLVAGALRYRTVEREALSYLKLGRSRAVRCTLPGLLVRALQGAIAGRTMAHCQRLSPSVPVVLAVGAAGSLTEVLRSLGAFLGAKGLPELACGGDVVRGLLRDVVELGTRLRAPPEL